MSIKRFYIKDGFLIHKGIPLSYLGLDPKTVDGYDMPIDLLDFKAENIFKVVFDEYDFVRCGDTADEDELYNFDYKIRLKYGKKEVFKIANFYETLGPVMCWGFYSIGSLIEFINYEFENIIEITADFMSEEDKTRVDSISHKIAFPIGYFIGEELKYRKISHAELFKDIEATREEIDIMLLRGGELTQDLAKKLEKWFEVSVQTWVNIDKHYHKLRTKMEEKDGINKIFKK